MSDPYEASDRDICYIAEMLNLRVEDLTPDQKNFIRGVHSQAVSACLREYPRLLRTQLNLMMTPPPRRTP